MRIQERDSKRQRLSLLALRRHTATWWRGPGAVTSGRPLAARGLSFTTTRNWILPATSGIREGPWASEKTAAPAHTSIPASWDPHRGLADPCLGPWPSETARKLVRSKLLSVWRLVLHQQKTNRVPRSVAPFCEHVFPCTGCCSMAVILPLSFSRQYLCMRFNLGISLLWIFIRSSFPWTFMRRLSANSCFFLFCFFLTE